MATYTYDLDNVTDRERIRFALGDTSAPFIFSDEELSMLLVDEPDWRGVVLVCIRSIIARLNEPDFTADWLSIKASSAVAGWLSLLRDLQSQYGLGQLTSRAVDMTRGDW